MYTKGKQLLSKIPKVIDLVGKIVGIGLLGHAESEYGLQFVLQATIQRLRTGFYTKFGSIP